MPWPKILIWPPDPVAVGECIVIDFVTKKQSHQRYNVNANATTIAKPGSRGMGCMAFEVIRDDNKNANLWKEVLSYFCVDVLDSPNDF